MGYTSSSDMRQQIRLEFDQEEAIAYAERNGIPYQPVRASRSARPKKLSYSDNFRRDRPQPWTH